MAMCCKRSRMMSPDITTAYSVTLIFELLRPGCGDTMAVTVMYLSGLVTIRRVVPEISRLRDFHGIIRYLTSKQASIFICPINKQRYNIDK